MWETAQLLHFSIAQYRVSNQHNTYYKIYKFSIAFQKSKCWFHFHTASKRHTFVISTDRVVGTALKLLKQFRIWLISASGATSKHFSSSLHLLQITSVSAASCSSPHHLLWLFWHAANKNKISCWQDYSHKHNKAHVAVAINANFASILRVMPDSAQHGCHSFTACLSS